MPIHKLPTKDETFVLLRGKVKVTTHNDDGSIIESVTLCPEEGCYGVNIPKGVWHTIESIESDSVIFECKEGPFVEHEVEGILEVKVRNEELKVEINPKRYMGLLLVCVCAAETPEGR